MKKQAEAEQAQAHPHSAHDFPKLWKVKGYTVSCVGDPDSVFQQDPVLALRAMHFVSCCDLSIEKRTAEAMERAPLTKARRCRVRKEFVRVLMGKFAATALAEHHRVIFQIIPEIEASVGFPQRNPAHIYDVWKHTAETMWEAPRDPVVRLALLLHDVGKPFCFDEQDGVRHFTGHGRVSARMAEAILARLGFDESTIHAVTQLVAYHDRLMIPSERTVYRMLGELGEEQFKRLLDVRYADISAQAHECFQARADTLGNLRCTASRLLGNVSHPTDKSGGFWPAGYNTVG